MLRFSPGDFVKHGSLELYGAKPDADKANSRTPKYKTSGARDAQSSPLRSDHIVLVAIDGLLALYATVKRYRARRRTRQILLALNDRQLQDIGLTREAILCGSDTWCQTGDQNGQRQSGKMER
jgi:uncharacterized protein YjiS (DUF1127 family)